jgi:mannose-6-phosphate isomerase-like protein (cupin superfamily)
MPVHIKKYTQIPACGSPPKIIREYFGGVNSKTKEVSIAHMQSPKGWSEPGQKPEFEEYTVVLKGNLLVEFKGGSFTVKENQAVLAKKGEWIRYSSPEEGGAEYIAICLPAFSPDTVHRDEA